MADDDTIPQVAAALLLQSARLRTESQRERGSRERSLIEARRRGHAERLIDERDDAYHVIKCAKIILLQWEGNCIRVTEANESAPVFLEERCGAWRPYLTRVSL